MHDKQGHLVLPTDVFVEVESWQFWWSLYGWQSCYWEDIYIHYKDKQGNQDHHSTEIITKGFLRALLEDESQKEYAEGECEWFGKSMEEMLVAENILFAYSYDSPDDQDFYEVEFDAPRNKHGIKPRYIAIFHPAEELSVQAVGEAVSRYCRDFCGIPFSNIHLIKKPKKSYARREYLHTMEEERKIKEFVEKGGRIKLQMAVPFLEQMYGKGEVERFDGEIDHGFWKEGNVFVKLKDGSEVPFGNPNMKIVDEKV